MSNYKYKCLIVTGFLALTAPLAWSQDVDQKPHLGTVEIFSAEQNVGNSIPSFTMKGEGVKVIYEALSGLTKDKIKKQQTSNWFRVIKFGKNLVCSKTEFTAKPPVIEYSFSADVLEDGSTGIFEP
ncbi:MAG: hypothetical protein IPL83_07615 [Bdellovibrionales bacterium]|nr:hypothetical protein [Bdellovibrionales bacterium]